MSKFRKPPCYENRALDNQWINLIYTSHDLHCGCLQPIKHLLDIIKETPWLRSYIDEDTKTTTEKGPTTEEFNIDAEDLEKLFEQKEDDNTG